MTKITKKALDQMREIMTGSLLGRLRHNQHYWHCGTAHCVAGWNTVLNHTQLYEQQKSSLNAMEGMGSVSTQDHIHDGKLAQADWGMNEQEAFFMFRDTATRALQIGLIEFFAAGHRLRHPDDQKKLQEYVKRYQGDVAKRVAWAKKNDRWWNVDKTARPHSELVAELIAAGQCKQQPAEQEVVQVEVCTVAQV